MKILSNVIQWDYTMITPIKYQTLISVDRVSAL